MIGTSQAAFPTTDAAHRTAARTRRLLRFRRMRPNTPRPPVLNHASLPQGRSHRTPAVVVSRHAGARADVRGPGAGNVPGARRRALQPTYPAMAGDQSSASSRRRSDPAGQRSADSCTSSRCRAASPMLGRNSALAGGEDRQRLADSDLLLPPQLAESSIECETTMGRGQTLYANCLHAAPARTPPSRLSPADQTAAGPGRR